MKTARCINCRIDFAIQDRDMEVCAQFEVPLPSWCPDCRQMRRIRHINQLRLFKRSCSATGQAIITNHPPYVPYPVFTQQYWYSDAVDNRKFGRDYDFSKPFFEQFFELGKVVPRPALFTDFTRDENSSYTNYSGKNRNCYLIFDSDENWDCLYSYSLNSCKNTLDSYRGDKLELCYEAIDCQNCYGCHFIQNCAECSDSEYLKNCIGVKNSLFCANLRQKDGFLFNVQSTPSEILKVKEETRNPSQLKKYLMRYNELLSSLPERALQGFRNENSVGNYLVHCKNAYQCFDCRDVWDGRYIYQAFMALKDSMDCNETGQAELLYECCDVGYNAYNCRFTLNCLNQITNLTYCDMCFLGCADLFGCIGMKKQSFCILNKQYTEQEYKALLPRIIDHMKNTGEWGQFFPPDRAHLAYNHSHAQIFYPLDRNEAAHLGFLWAEEETDIQSGDTAEGGGNICRSCAKKFRVTQQEAAFYKNASIGTPDLCFHCRHAARVAKRAPRMLIDSACASCNDPLKAQFSKHPGPVYCEGCFAEHYL